MSRRSATTTKVFVGSLPQGTTSEELRQLFEPYGEIAECDVVNHCGFLHMEDRTLAMKAIEELNNTTFKGTRISVERGRISEPNRDRGGGGRGSRNGFGGPMRGGRDMYRGGPYVRNGGNDYDRPPQRGGMSRGGFKSGFERFGRFGGGPPPRTGGPNNDGFSNGDRRPMYMNDRGNDYRVGGFNDGYKMNTGNMNQQTPYEHRGMSGDFKPMGDRNMMGDRRAPEDRRPMLGERRPMFDQQGGPNMGRIPPNSAVPPNVANYNHGMAGTDMFSRRNTMNTKPMGGYGEPAPQTGFDNNTYPPIQNRNFAGGPGGPGPRRDMQPAYRY